MPANGFRQKRRHTGATRALNEALTVIGSQAKLARILRIKPPSVSHIITTKARVPAEWCLKIERATRGLVRASDLRPDLYPVNSTSLAPSKRAKPAPKATLHNAAQ